VRGVRVRGARARGIRVSRIFIWDALFYSLFNLLEKDNNFKYLHTDPPSCRVHAMIGCFCAVGI
jgi:hypothetical protein